MQISHFRRRHYSWSRVHSQKRYLWAVKNPSASWSWNSVEILSETASKKEAKNYKLALKKVSSNRWSTEVAQNFDISKGVHDWRHWHSFWSTLGNFAMPLSKRHAPRIFKAKFSQDIAYAYKLEWSAFLDKFSLVPPHGRRYTRSWYEHSWWWAARKINGWKRWWMAPKTFL